MCLYFCHDSLLKLMQMIRRMQKLYSHFVTSWASFSIVINNFVIQNCYEPSLKTWYLSCLFFQYYWFVSFYSGVVPLVVFIKYKTWNSSLTLAIMKPVALMHLLIGTISFVDPFHPFIKTITRHSLNTNETPSSFHVDLNHQHEVYSTLTHYLRHVMLKMSN